MELTRTQLEADDITAACEMLERRLYVGDTVTADLVLPVLSRVIDHIHSARDEAYAEFLREAAQENATALDLLEEKLNQLLDAGENNAAILALQDVIEEVQELTADPISGTVPVDAEGALPDATQGPPETPWSIDAPAAVSVPIHEWPALASLIQAQAKQVGVTDLAAAAGMSREGLSKALAPGKQPSIVTVIKVLSALGYQLEIKHKP
jgi:hypothetical protein